ncbi:hypothetical protein B296_00028848 [Ensete ventricosum]|uniref:Uncharacterized protein n=1 Tax=Ensete ventricosum TaxID=4639 RepID=A0A427AMB2_ENSVE|nr:hypothetical protein B296_00028848 [Ensete ventricosum]
MTGFRFYKVGSSGRYPSTLLVPNPVKSPNQFRLLWVCRMQTDLGEERSSTSKTMVVGVAPQKGSVALLSD